MVDIPFLSNKFFSFILSIFCFDEYGFVMLRDTVEAFSWTNNSELHDLEDCEATDDASSILDRVTRSFGEGRFFKLNSPLTSIHCGLDGNDSSFWER